MKFRELSAFLESEFAYPVSTDDVVEQAGTVPVDAPDDDDSETIETILSRVAAGTYESADDLYNTIIGNVSDDYIGRKFYDDRGGDPAESWTMAPGRARSF
ncbi:MULTISPECIES: hypothetical protein [Haloferax]|uniref:DUF2795 domain-containing protein n=1 Tax=Haloferax marinum TaxID=2666143 RepID=A0A6A8GAA3_9EURY|nr:MULTISPECIES: hypothetical protein [Haloferax]KAB1198427.1 hypothetical protein Hfx1150_13250 [Haloferax sp. CBA1150]MRW97528.1 hypothetical protein [Haloferax marinum]